MLVKLNKIRLSNEYKETLGLVELENEEANISKAWCELTKLLVDSTRDYKKYKRDVEEYERKFFYSKKTLEQKRRNMEIEKEYVDTFQQMLDDANLKKCDIKNEKKKIISDVLYKWLKDDCDDLEIGDKIQCRVKGVTFDVEIVDPSLYQDNPNNLELYELSNE